MKRLTEPKNQRLNHLNYSINSVVRQERNENLLTEPILTKSATRILEYMHSFQNDTPIQTTYKGNDTPIHVAHKEIITALSISRITVIRALKQLKESGYIDIISGKKEGKQNTYFLRDSVKTLQRNSRKENIIVKNFNILPHTTKKIRGFMFPLDKVNSTIWNNTDDISTTETTILLKAEPDKSKRQVTNTVILCLDERKDNSAIQRLTQYDLRVYMAIGNLYKAGNSKISIRDIYKAMGNNSNLTTSQKKKILLSIEKMSSIRITIDTTEEEQAGYRYPNLHIKRRNLIYTKVDVALKRGQETEVIVLMEEPVLFQFALLRNQYTTVPATLLCSPVSKTEATLAIENYLLRRITERGKTGGTILLSTVYEKAGLKDKKQKQRAKQKIKDILNYYKEQDFISDYDICMNDNKAKPEECIKIKKK